MLRTVIANMPTAILNASLLSVSLGLGEYTVASILNYENLQVAIQYVSLVSASTSIAVALASLLFAFVLLMVLSFVGRLQLRVSPGQKA
jgi:putative spermidine/putrescine transport system permease protein